MASAIVNLDKETQFQKQQATYSLGYRQYLCWDVGIIIIGVHYPECRLSKTSYCQPPPGPRRIQRTTNLTAGGSSPQWVPSRLFWRDLCGTSGCRGHCLPISSHLAGWFIMSHLKQSLHFVCFLFFSLLSTVSESCVLSNLRPSKEDTKLGA